MSLTRDLARLNIDSAGAFSPFSVNRLTSDGEIISLKKDGTQVLKILKALEWCCDNLM